MAVMSEFLEHKAMPWRDEWTGKTLKHKPSAYRPYDKSFVVIPRRYTGSPKEAVACLVLNCADELDAKQTYYLDLGIDPAIQYTDVQPYQPAAKPSNPPRSTKLVESGG